MPAGETKLYAVVMRDHAYYLVGPFVDRAALSQWAEVEQAQGDDPRWQSIELPYRALLPVLHGPDFHPGS